MDWKQLLIDAGLPCVSAEVNQFGRVDASFERSLTQAEWLAFLRITDTKRYRHENAVNEARLATELRTRTAAEVAQYVEQQITNGVSETSALAAFDNASTFAAAKPILRNMLIAIYRSVDILKIMAKMLIAMRDQIWPELPDE